MKAFLNPCFSHRKEAYPMKRQKIAGIFADPQAFGGQALTVCGWVRTVRDMKNFGFIELNDGSCFKGVQVVFEANKVADFAAVAKLNVGTAVIVTGDLILTPEAKQPFEIKAQTIEVEETMRIKSRVEEAYPFLELGFLDGGQKIYDYLVGYSE